MNPNSSPVRNSSSTEGQPPNNRQPFRLGAASGKPFLRIGSASERRAFSLGKGVSHSSSRQVIVSRIPHVIGLTRRAATTSSPTVDEWSNVAANISVGSTTYYVFDQYIPSGTPSFLSAHSTDPNNRDVGKYVEFLNVAPVNGRIIFTNTSEGGVTVQLRPMGCSSSRYQNPRLACSRSGGWHFDAEEGERLEPVPIP